MSSHSVASRPSLSTSETQPSQEEPVPLNSETRPNVMRANSTTPSSDSLRRYASVQSGMSAKSARYSVQEIYGDMDSDDIENKRLNNQNEILRTLSRRVSKAASREQTALFGDLEDQKRSDEKSLYEDLPDTAVPTKDFGGEFTEVDPELVAWDGPDDPDYPRNWPKGKKIFQTFIVAIYTLVSPMTSSVLSPAMADISESLHITNSTVESLCVSVMVLAWCLGPLIIAPLSESDRIGRGPVLTVSIWLNFIFNLACGFAKTTAQLCVFRFLGGLGGCAPLNVGAGTLADIWSDDQRLYAMAFYSLGPSLGPTIAPVISGFVVERTNWHWCFYYLSIFNFCVAVFGLIFLKESYSPKLLRNKAERLRKETGNSHLHTIYEVADGETFIGKVAVAASRPVSLILFHPMVFGLGLFMAFCYGFMYLLIVTFPTVYQQSYGFRTEIACLFYIPLGIGFILGTIIFTPLNQKVYDRLRDKNNGVGKPEFRLPVLIFSGVGIPIALIWYGWSAQKKLHWIMPSIGSAIFAICIVPMFMNVQNYLIDMNNRFAASSVAAAAVFRSLFGFTFPLFATRMFDALGLGWGTTMFAFIGLLLGVPFPLFCLRYGERLRGWANARFDKQQAKRDQKNLQRLQAMKEKQMKKEEKPQISDSSTN